LINIPALTQILSENTSVKALPKVIFEYNMNEMAGTVEVTTSSTQSDIIKELFPAKSIVQSFRPSKAGVRYAILGTGLTLNTYKTKTIPTTRTYMVDKNIPYTYFLAQGSAAVTVSYKNKAGNASQNILTNKISVRVETGHGSNAIAIGSLYSGSVPSTGIVDIWYNGTSWTTTEPSTYATPQSISSLTVTVSGGTFNSIIEVSPKYVIDVTDRVSSVNIDKDDSMNDDKLPVGMLTANAASINLSTIAANDIVQFLRGDTIVSNKVMVTNNIKCTVKFIIEDTHFVQQGIFYINDYNSDEYGNYSIKALDVAKFLQEIPCPEIMLSDSSFQAIMWRILDAVGFVDYDFSKCTADILTCKFWWGDSNKSAWQAIQEICRESQTVAYVNEYGTLVFIDRDTFYSSIPNYTWTFRSTPSGNIKPDIIQLSSSARPTTNAVRVKYNIPTTSSQEASSQPLWTEQSPSTLFAAPFKGIASGYIMYPERGVFSDVIPTRFNSYVLIGGEIIEYDAIRFTSPDGEVDISSAGQYLELRAKHNNNLSPTGKLRIKTRNVFGSANTTANAVQSPTAILNGYSAKQIKLGTNTNNDVALAKVCAMNQSGNNMSALSISASGSKDDLYVVSKTFPHTSDSEFFQIGTAVGFELAAANQIGIQQTSGMTFFWNSTTNSGYLLLLYSTRTAQNIKQQSEAALYKVVSGIPTLLKSVTSNIFEQSFYGLDILVHKESAKNTIFVSVNGSTIEYEDSSSPIAATSTIGLVAGGQSTAYFDYLYSLKRDSFTFDISASRSNGKILASAFFQKFTYDSATIANLKYDEFGDVIREIYKAEAQYDPAYAIAAQPSDALAQIVGQRLGYYKGEFYVFNTSSSTIALSGGDGKDLFVYGVSVANSGQNFYNSDDKITDVKQITSFDSQWIQSKEAAKSLSDFLTKQWSKSTIDVDMDIFGNPVLQVGDIVTINYPERGFDGSGKFVIRSISHSMDIGISTKIKLRSIYSA
jgi:hypothetical protein